MFRCVNFLTHDDRFAKEELLINREHLPWIADGTLLEITQEDDVTRSVALYASVMDRHLTKDSHQLKNMQACLSSEFIDIHAFGRFQCQRRSHSCLDFRPVK